jgi:16S rRNA (adenine1518-N6/adenine1519-N6)-dimethyltransferase
MCPIKAKAGYGQHFLASKKMAEKIISACAPTRNDNFLEIGSGKGALTRILVDKAGNVTAIELDKELARIIRDTYKDCDNIKIINADFLEYRAVNLAERLKIIGNVPYNITSPILEKLFEFRDKMDFAVFTIQKEVADKLTASSGLSGYGKLTLLMWSGFATEQLFSIPRKAFSPPPKVASRVVKITPIDRGITDFAEFSAFITACFSQKNRTLMNSIQIGFDWPKEMCEYLLKQAEFNLKVRPKEINNDDYLKLYQIWQAIR